MFKGFQSTRRAEGMEQYLTGYHVTDDHDEGMYNGVSSDDEIERVYHKAEPTVYSHEPPPPRRIHENLKLESQYSEGSGDEDDESDTPKGFNHITEMIRQVEPEYVDESLAWKELAQTLPSPKNNKFGVILTKTPLNPDSPVFCPNAAADVTLQRNGSSPARAEAVKRQARTAPRCRNIAMKSLSKINELHKKFIGGLMTPDDFALSKCASLSVASSAGSSSPPAAVDNPSLPQCSGPTVDSIRAAGDLVDAVRDIETPPVDSGAGDNVRLSNTKTDSPLTSSILQSKSCPPLDFTPSDFFTEAPVRNESPKVTPAKSKKEKDFVPTAKSTELLNKINKRSREKELEKAAGRTSENRLSDFIEVKLNEHKNKNGGNSSSSTPVETD